MESRFANEKTTREVLSQSDIAGDCCKSAPYIGGGIICVQHDQMYIFDFNQGANKGQWTRIPRQKMNVVLNHYKNARPSLCGGRP